MQNLKKLSAQTTFMKRYSLSCRCGLIALLLLYAAIVWSYPTICPQAKSIPDPVKTICFTFDDGPTDSTTPKILDILKKEKIHATFFVIGKQIKNREDIIRRIHTEGHAIGIHTYSHEYKNIYASSDALLNDIQKCKAAIQSVLPDFSTTLYRFPGGSFSLSKKLIASVLNAGYHYYDWNASVEDAVSQNASPEELFKNAINSSKGKNKIILLLHDGVGYKATIRCLPKLIRYYRSQNYFFETL